MSTVNLNVGDFENWEFSYPPAEILTATSGWEGGQFEPEPSETATAPENVNQIRDPYVFEDSDGSLYLIYAGNGEDALGIAALSSPRQDIEILRPVEDSYTRGGTSEDDNFGRENTLDIKQGNSENFFRRAYLNFRINNPQNVDAAVLRLYATRSRNDADITLFSTENGWDEDTITWDNAPPDGAVIDRVTIGPEDTYYEWDVSSYIVGEDRENVSFVLYDEGRDNTLVSFSSSEGSNPPELKLLYARGNTTVSNLVLNAASIVDQPQQLSVTQSAGSTQLASTEISTEASTEVTYKKRHHLHYKWWRFQFLIKLLN